MARLFKDERPDRQGATLTLSEVAEAYKDSKYPPILTLAEAAEIARRRPSTLKRFVSEGKFKGCVRRGKPLLFWRNRFAHRVMEGLS